MDYDQQYQKLLSIKKDENGTKKSEAINKSLVTLTKAFQYCGIYENLTEEVQKGY